jgi:hypothetical protein
MMADMDTFFFYSIELNNEIIGEGNLFLRHLNMH